MTDDKIRLTFEYLGAEKVEELIRLNQGLDTQIKNVTASATTVEKKLKDVTAEKQKTTRATADLGRGFLELSRGMEDAQYGMAGVLNNLPGMVMQFGGPAGLAAMVSITAVAAKVLYDQWDNLANLFRETTPITNLGTAMQALEKAIKENKDALKEMEKLTAMTVDQEARYKDLLKESVELEQKKTAEQNRQLNIKKLLEGTPATEAAAEAERAELLAEYKGPAGMDIAESMMEAMDVKGKAKAKITAQNQQLMAAMKDLDPVTEAEQIKEIVEVIGNTQARFEKEQKKLEDEVTNMVSEAVIGGKLEPFKKIREMMKDQPEMFRPEEMRAFGQAAPEALAGDQAFEARNAALGDRGKVRREKEKAADDAETKRIAAQVRAANALEEQTDKEAGLATRLQENHEKIAMDVAKAQVKQLNQAEEARIKETGIDVKAAEALAEAKARGGMIDPRTGRMIKMTEAQQFEAVRGQVAQELHRPTGEFDRFGRPLRANAGMGREETEQLSTRITARGVETMKRNLNATGNLMMVVQGLDAEVSMVIQKQNNMDQGINVLKGKGNARRRGAQKVR